MASVDTLHKILKRNFGYDTFRPKQIEVIQNILSGNDTVVLMPTGGGKSLCYQIPALVLPGLTVVVSPLIALMQDQVESLLSNGIQAAYLNSTQTPDEVMAVMTQIDRGTLKLLYVSPERIFSQGFITYLKGANVQLFAIDEAHCVSSWGHHFRPEYKMLSVLKEQFPDTALVALTATADRVVRGDIGLMLGMDNPQIFIDSFDRPNLSMAVLPGQKKYQQLTRVLARHKNRSGIIYCQSRKSTESLAEKLSADGFRAEAYHGRMQAQDRAQVQTDFIQGDVDIVCATVAFGMGIDKSDVRFVVHYNMPNNLEGYYQEIGRAGRDGRPSETVLFYSYRDVQVHMNFISEVQDHTYRQILTEKLGRMQEFAEAQICRRSILLSYFSEQPAEDCGNCDVCRNPPQYLDGTIEAQMVLSAVYRTREQVAMSTCVDILRGTLSEDVRRNSHQQLKTFGIGRNLSPFAWQLYIQQLVQQGALEIDYREKNRLRLTNLSQKILFENKQIRLVSIETIQARQEEQKQLAKQAKASAKVKPAEHGEVDEELFQYLRKLRSTLAFSEGKAPYMIFSDKSLKDMARIKPLNDVDFLEIHGVGAHKLEKYGEVFIHAIQDFDKL